MASFRSLASTTSIARTPQILSRSISSLTRSSPSNALRRIDQKALQQNFRRSYAILPPEPPHSSIAPPPPPPPKKRRWRTLRWAWRVTWMGTLAGVVYTGYGIYQNRTPAEQELPDPNKKTLVVLGTSILLVAALLRSSCWYKRICSLTCFV